MMWDVCMLQQSYRNHMNNKKFDVWSFANVKPLLLRFSSQIGWDHLQPRRGTLMITKEAKYKLQLFMFIFFSISGVINNFRMVYRYYKRLLFFCLSFTLSQQTVKYIKYRHYHRPVTELTYTWTKHYLMTQVSEKDYFNTTSTTSRVWFFFFS